MKMHFKRGDEVVVLSGSHAGKRGKVLEMQVAKGRAIVEGVAIVKKHIRKSEDKPQGGIVEREASLHVSKLMLASKFDARRAKRGQAA
jgi:large subunit ribosomal protein L24